MKKRHHEEHENHERWLVSYADFITLLFAFFTVLYATSQQDVKKEEEFEKSIRQSMKGKLVFFIGDGDQENNPDATSLLKPPIELFPPMNAGPEEIEDYVERKLDKELEKQKDDYVDGVGHDVYGVKVKLAAAAVFPMGSANIREEALGVLDKIGSLLKDSNRKIIIEGHTDDTPVRKGEFATNWELSASRATKIVRYLILKHKIEPGRIAAVAYADQKPLAPNTDEKNRAKNRRIEIRIVTKDTAL